MGYQETMIKTKFKHFESIKKDIEENNLMFFVSLIGYYYNPRKKLEPDSDIFIVVAGDRHPLADFLLEKYDAKPVEEVEERLIDILWENYAFQEDTKISYQT